MDRYTNAWTATSTLIRQGRSFSGHERHCCFLNTGSLPFADVSATVGLDLPEDGRAVATVDWDHDGDLDLWITNRTAPRVRFFRNDFPKRHFLSVRLEGRTCNRDAVGARLELYLADAHRPKRIKTLRAGDGFLSQSSKSVIFGLGAHAKIERLVVRWPGDDAEEFHDLTVDRHYTIVQHSGRADVWTPPRTSSSLIPSRTEVPTSSEQARIVLAGRIPLPDVTYKNHSGDLIPLIDQSSDGPWLVHLWASWCQPCLVELQEFSRNESQLRDRHVNVLALSVERLDESSVSGDPGSILRGMDFPFASGTATPSLVDALDTVQRTVLDRKRPLPVPCNFLIDRHGQLAVIYKGPVGVAQLLADLKLLDQQPAQLRDLAIPFPGRWATPPKSIDPMQIATALYENGLVELAKAYTWRIDSFLVERNAAGLIDASTQKRKQADAHAYRGVILQKQKRFQEAIDAFRRALESQPQDVRLHRNLGQAYAKRGQMSSAARHLSAAVAILPDDYNLHYQLAMALSDLGRQKEANEHYRQALRVKHGWPPAANNLAWILATHADPTIRDGAAAVGLAQAACRRVRFRDPAGLDTLAAAHAEAGNFAAAIQVAERAIELARNQGKTSLADRIQQRLQLYRAHRPYRDVRTKS